MSANLAKENEEMKPKAKHFDLYLNDEGTLSLNQVAKALKTKRNKMMDFLRHKRIFNQDNSPSSYYSNKGYFEVKNFTYVIKNGNRYQIAITRVTSNEQDFLYRYLTKHINEYAKFDNEYSDKMMEEMKKCTATYLEEIKNLPIEEQKNIKEYIHKSIIGNAAYKNIFGKLKYGGCSDLN